MKKVKHKKMSIIQRKYFNKRILFKALVALVVLSSILLSSLLSVTNAEYLKTISKTLEVEVSPDLKLEYYLYDADSVSGTAYSGTTGLYENSKSFSQEIIIGTDNTTDTNKVNSSKVTMKNSNDVEVRKQISGRRVVYQIMSRARL